jgi:hypothetical protein
MEAVIWIFVLVQWLVVWIVHCFDEFGWWMSPVDNARIAVQEVKRPWKGFPELEHLFRWSKNSAIAGRLLNRTFVLMDEMCDVIAIQFS